MLARRRRPALGVLRRVSAWQWPCQSRVATSMHKPPLTTTTTTTSTSPAPTLMNMTTLAKSVAASAQVTAAPSDKLTLKERAAVYAQLSKVRLSSLVVMTTGAGFLMAGGPIAWPTFAAATIGTSLAAASANSFNQLWEVERDRAMMRTHRRPLPMGKISKPHAFAFGAATAVSSTAILALGCSPLVASLGVANIGLYALAYTPMKARSELNTWVGSIVGAIPPIMGWAAATGTVLAPEAALQAALLFCWQMPHFFALSWRARKDYARGGFRMVACRDPTGKQSAALALRYSLYMGWIPIAAALTDATSYMFTVEGTLVNAYAVYAAYKFYRKPSNGTAHKVFMCSLWYLPVMLALMLLHSNNWLEDDERQIKRNRHKYLLQRNTSLQPTASLVPAEDESAASARFVDSVRRMRHWLKERCLHYRLFGAKDAAFSGEKDASVMCPVVVAETVKETLAITSLATRESTVQTPEDEVTKSSRY